MANQGFKAIRQSDGAQFIIRKSQPPAIDVSGLHSAVDEYLNPEPCWLLCDMGTGEQIREVFFQGELRKDALEFQDQDGNVYKIISRV